MKTTFSVRVDLTLEHEPGQKMSKHVATDINIIKASQHIDLRAYLDKGVPTKEGSKVLTSVLTQGLIANIHSAHQAGHVDSAEHLRIIIKELERGFINVATVSTAHFNDNLNNEDTDSRHNSN